MTRDGIMFLDGNLQTTAVDKNASVPIGIVSDIGPHIGPTPVVAFAFVRIRTPVRLVRAVTLLTGTNQARYGLRAARLCQVGLIDLCKLACKGTLLAPDV